MCCCKIISIFAISLFFTLTFGNKLDLSWKGLTKEKFFRDQNGSVSDQIEKATELNLRGNLFDRFLDCSGKLDRVEVIDLSQNNLKEFYFICTEQDNLFKLNVSHNKLSFLNDTTLTDRMTRLQVLDLSHNIIQLVTQETFQHLQNLNYLYLDANPIGKNIREGAFNNLKSLIELHLSDISAYNFPQDLFTPLINLKYLSLALNPLEEIPALPTGLETLDISGTNIINLNNVDLPKLRILLMNSMPRLESLNLNQLEKLRKLTHLSIENTPGLKNLTALPTREDLLPNLKQLSVKNCSIDKLGADLQSIMNRTSLLDLQDNPLHCDCRIRKILSSKSTINYHDHLRCRTPPELRDKRIFEIPADQFYCDGINYLALGLALSVLVMASLVAGISYIAREPILRKWRSRSKHGETVSYKNIKSNANDTEKILEQCDITDCA